MEASRLTIDPRRLTTEQDIPIYTNIEVNVAFHEAMTAFHGSREAHYKSREA
jgi:hypothetical protein